MDGVSMNVWKCSSPIFFSDWWNRRRILGRGHERQHHQQHERQGGAAHSSTLTSRNMPASMWNSRWQ